jgi:hypothetical protein
MRILATLDLPDAGDARIGGVSIVDYPEKHAGSPDSCRIMRGSM